MTGKYQFVMDTKGHCFLCLKKSTPAPRFASDDDDDVGLADDVKFIPNISSFQNVCQYLNTNLKEVLGDGNTTVSSDSDSLPILEEPEVKGIMCEGCAQLNELFSEHFLELEVIQMKLQSDLKSICDKMMDVEKNKEGILDVFTKKMLGQPETELQYGIVERLRKTTIEQCFKLTEELNPSVTLRNMEHLMPDHSNTEAVTVIKQQSVDGENDTESQSEVGDDPLEASSNEAVPPQPPSADKSEKYYTINPVTRMFLCSFCPRQSKTRHEMRNHYKGVHLGRSHKCRYCERSYYLSSDLRLHQQFVHLGTKFCPSLFNRRAIKKRNYLLGAQPSKNVSTVDNTAIISSVVNSTSNYGSSATAAPTPGVKSRSLELTSNQKRPKSDNKFNCQFCSQIFLLNSSRHTHMRTCSKRPQNEAQGANPSLPIPITINTSNNLLGTFILPHGDPTEAVKKECKVEDETVIKMEEEEVI